MRKAVAMALAVSLIASSVASAQRERRPPSNLDSGAQIATESNILPSGTVIVVKLENKLDSGSTLISDRFRARVFRAVSDTKGRELIPQGAFVEGYVTDVKPAQSKRRSGLISVTFDILRMTDGRALPMAGNLTSADPDDRKRIDEEGNIKPSGGNTLKNIFFIGGSTASGAAIGWITGGLLLGAGIGAAAGVVGVWLRKGKEAVVEPGTLFGVELTRPIDVSYASAGIVRLDPRPRETRPSLAEKPAAKKVETAAQPSDPPSAKPSTPPEDSPAIQPPVQSPVQASAPPSTAAPLSLPAEPPVAAPKIDASLAEVGARVADKASVLATDYATSIGARRRDDGRFDFPTQRILKVEETELLFTLSSLQTSTETLRGVLGAEASMDSRRRGADRLTVLSDEARRLWAVVKPKAELDRKWVALDKEIRLLVEMAKAGS